MGPLKQKEERYNHKDANSHKKSEEAWNGIPTRVSGSGVALPIPYFCLSDIKFGLLTSRTMREYIFVVLSRQVFGNVLTQEVLELDL